jgi:glycosyltransferase involved in cell wall biosynthesis
MQEHTPKVSVLISTFNRPDLLKEAVQTVVDQKMTDWELLIMNDGGTDVAHVIESFNDPRIRYFPDDVNKGAAHRFNFGLNNARGDYVTYLGDDDKFYPNHLEVLSRTLDENPGIALAYSDLYAVSCIKDEQTGKRHVLDKRIVVSRDFNRNFMFHYNHVLHVSLMHRKEAALRVGGFDESVKVLIEWSLNRRLCFIFDFKHVPVVTGEYYMPVFKSDRISVVQRKNKVEYRHNLRKIRCNLPPEPWPKIDRVTMIYPVAKWDDKLNTWLEEIIDNVDHPFRLVLVNNGTGLKESQCRKSLGQLSELKNIYIKTPPQKLDNLAAYRYAAKKSNADYLFLITDNFQVKAQPKRIFGGLEHLKKEEGKCEAVKWDVEEERKTPFDVLIRREVFLKRSHPKKGQNTIDIQHLQQVIASGFKFDAIFGEYNRKFSKGEYQEAYNLLQAALAIPHGAPDIQYLIHPMVKTCLAMEKPDQVEKEVRALIDRGYECDNYIRLGQILQATNRFQEAIEAYQKGMDGYGWVEPDFESQVFPINFPKELTAFTTLMGMGECHFETGQRVEAARMFHRAAKLRANSHRPFLGFAKLYLASNQLDRAETAMAKIGQRNGRKDPETHRVLGKLCQRRNRLDIAFGCYLKAFEVGKADEKNIDPLYYAGAALGKWQEMKPVLETFLEAKPNHIGAITRMASVYQRLGDTGRALELARRGINLDSANVTLRGIIRQLEQYEPKSELEPITGLVVSVG